MAKLPIGLVLRQIFDEGIVATAQLVEKLGKSKQSVYNDFKRTDMSNGDLLKWADALNISVEEIHAVGIVNLQQKKVLLKMGMCICNNTY